MKKYAHKLAHAGLVLLTLAAFCGTTAPATAQTTREDKFTLTNGRLWWFDGVESDSDDLWPAGKKIPIAVDSAILDQWGDPVDCYISGEAQNEITHITQRGTVYLVLDTTGVGAAIDAHQNPRLVPKVGQRAVSSGFTPMCAWNRTGYTGYYYIEWYSPNDRKSYRSYLIGTKNALEIYTIEVGEPNEKNSLWFNWDFGAAITNVSYNNGVRQETNHWLYYDTVGLGTGQPNAGQWKMSGDSYERPEVIAYRNYSTNPPYAELHKQYYYSYQDAGGAWHAYGDGALFLPLTQINHNIVIDQAAADPALGLQDIILTETTSSNPKNTLKYGEELNAKVNIVRGAGDVLTIPVTPSYTEYVEETYRRGIHLNYRYRNSETFGSNGIGTTTTYYYKNGQLLSPNAAPSSNPKELTFVEATYSIDNNARHYLHLHIGSGEPTTFPVTTDAESTPVTVHCYSVPTSTTATLTAMVKYSFTDAGETYYVYDTIESTINLSRELNKRTNIDPVNAPVVMGYICGGGRMANVGWDNGTASTNDITGGQTKITIHNADSIYALYGGNDIAGWVQGHSNIYIGSMQTVFPLNIAYIYGGGCGYYSYQNIYDASTQTFASDGSITDVVTLGQYCFRGKVYEWDYRLGSDAVNGDDAHIVVNKVFNYEPYTSSSDPQAFQLAEKGQEGDGTVPYIKSAHVYIGVDETTAGSAAIAAQHNDLIHIDTLFGGAENAFIGIQSLGTDQTAITLDIHGGTIMASFGGNNYGGYVANGALVNTTVYNTKITDELNTVNTYFTGYGRDFGIRHLYGGGNMVVSSYAKVNIYGGMVDTCFVGGNQASVVQPVGTINCRDGKFIYDNPTLDFLKSTDPNYVNLADWSTLDLSDPADMTAWEAGIEKILKTNPGAYRGGEGRYNVRCFFGGNNKADMANLSYIHLSSGGVGRVYGGGNQGDMINTVKWDSSFYKRNDRGPITTENPITTEHPLILDLGDSVRGSLSGNGWFFEMPTVFGSMVNSPQHSCIIVDNIYGGCRRANVLHSSGLSLSGGVFGNVNGGCDISGDVGSSYPNEGTWVIVDSNAIVLHDAYGGSDGFYHCHISSNGTYSTEDVYRYPGVASDYYHDYVGLLTPTQNNSNLYINGGYILHAAYGGGVMCDIGYEEGARPKKYNYENDQTTEFSVSGGPQHGSIHLLMNSGVVGSPYWHHNANLLDGNTNIAASTLASNRAAAKAAGKLSNQDGNIYGGGYLSSLYGLSYFKIQGDSKVYGSVFSSNDCMGRVRYFGKYKIDSDSITITEANFLASDGTTELNGTDNANFASYLLIEGTPRLANVYGGGNGAYNYKKPDRPEYSDFEPVCMDYVTDFRPTHVSSFIDIHTKGGFIDTVFGGGNGVGVDDNVRVLFNIADATLSTDSYVGTIFGGNNRDDMTKCVPIIDLHRGVVTNVYGGGNAGSMKGGDDFTDVCGNPVKNVSTYVHIESPDVTIKGNVFGGCRMAEVANMAYVDVRNTNAAGIQYLYGGNDIAGTVSGNTRIDVSGGTIHHIWGGSNGYYDYQVIDPRTDVHVYPFGYTPLNGSSLTLADTVNAIAMHTTGEPYVDSTTINLYGGTIMESVYGGGRMGDCRATTVVVDNQACTDTTGNYRDLTINGSVYGGGEGDWAHLDKPHRGNTGENTTGLSTGSGATGATHVHLKSATSLSSATAYGGGKGGDAYNTYITTYDTWSQTFDAIYGGCWGSDVKGTTHVELNGITQNASQELASGNLYTARNVFGGNDFTGNVYASEVNVHSGTYGNIYGAGDGYGGVGGESVSTESAGGISTSGAYEDLYTNNTYGTGLTVPNTEYVTVNVDDGRVGGNLYGGGKLGSTFCYKKDSEGAYVLSGGHRIPDTTQTKTDAYADPEKYSHITVNVHGGVFDNNVFAGASGQINGDRLVYGLKILNMDGGVVNHSVYGGSANVSDGYWHECKVGTAENPALNSTERPSSILNIAAANIGHNVYGGGYLGIFNGSAYINIGMDAIDNSKVWTKTIAGQDNAYAGFKPERAVLSSTHELTIGQSVYSGPNWGASSGSADFTQPGVMGGETRIFIDGNGYNTGILTTDAVKPAMNIGGSIIGAGTSANGGDIYSRIDLRNYGGLNNNCKPNRHILAIQRADAVWLNNTSIEYDGTTDAITAYLSVQITLNRIDTLHCVGYNIIDVDHTITNIGEVNYWKHAEYPYYPRFLAENTDLTKCWTNSSSGCDACDNTHDYVCHQMNILDRFDNSKKYTGLFIEQGINVDFVNENGIYSAVFGYAYLMADTGTNAIVTARPKYNGTNTGNTGVTPNIPPDGGFLSVCSDSLQALTGRTMGEEWDLEWCGCVLNAAGTATTDTNHAHPTNTTTYCIRNNEYIAEYPYYNYNQNYRVWSLGQGSRKRYAVVQAHSDVDNPLADNKKITLHHVEGANSYDIYNLAIAHSVLRLPPTKPGHYYRIDATYGIELSDENEEMRLVDQAYLPRTWVDDSSLSLTNYWGLTGSQTTKPYEGDAEITGTAGSYTGVLEPSTHGDLKLLSAENGSASLGINYIYNNPNTYFGLMMMSGKYFAKNADSSLVAPKPYKDNGSWYGGTTISGNSHVNVTQNFSTAEVGAANNASPELDLYMLYDNRFSHTILGTVKLILNEYEATEQRNAHGDYVKIIDADNDPQTHQAADTIIIAYRENNGTYTWQTNSETGNPYTSNDIVWIDRDLKLPIEVEISLSTVLEDFTDMEYELLAMYNEGRSNTFARKVVLPATLQTREVFLKDITWAPTDGDGNFYDAVPANPKQFYLTDNYEGLITADSVSENNRFGLSMYVTDNISNSLTSSVGWYDKVMKTERDLYALSGYSGTGIGRKRTSSPDDANYLSGSPITPVSITSAADGAYGQKLGVLDGRGEAAIVVTLNFDGRRIYPKTPDKGYVGKAVLHLVSYNTQTDQLREHPNNFDLTIYVKTRAYGDTIYIASTQDHIERGGRTVYSHWHDPAATLTTDCGKNPDDYLYTFEEAFKGPYKEGDVIAILDEVVIDGGTNVFIKGEEYMPINVIRYSGHHHLFPGELCAYRDAMITVTGENTAFSARCITFNGSMLTKIKPQIRVGSSWEAGTWLSNTEAHRYTPGTGGFFDGQSESDWLADHPEILDDFTLAADGSVEGTNDKHADTLKALGPVIRVDDHATVTLQNATSVINNYNIYSGDVASLHGAISVTNRGVLQMVNNVTVKEIISKKLDGDTREHPLNGAVYVDNGIFNLLTSPNESTSIIIAQNLQADNPDVAGAKFWQLDNVVVKGLSATSVPVHYSFMESSLFDGTTGELTNNNFSLANVFLTRTYTTAEPSNDRKDQKSDMIHLSSAPKAGTKIGISKWFPGPSERDTIQVVFQSTSTGLQDAVYTRKNFFSDDNYNVFYNYGVNNQRVFLHRCATFNFQQGDGTELYTTTGGVQMDFNRDRALDYLPLTSASCPTGGDQLVARLQGGFLPYTYSWHDNKTNTDERSYTTPYTCMQTNSMLQNHYYDYLRLAVADTLVTPPVTIPFTESEGNYNYSITATDVTGFCTLQKDIYVKLVKDITDTPVDPINFNYDGTYTAANWSDNANWTADTYTGTQAKGIRTYKAIKITPYVSPNSSYGNIIAAVGNQIYDQDLPGSGIQTLSFCEGDVIRLAATPASGTQFVMWDFSPYYETPTTYVIPSASTDVIAYFSPTDYWVQAVDSPEDANAVYDNNFAYSARPVGAGYVTTYHGDVHIYDENGLAWFISVVNGLNGTQARPFFFNTVYLHDKDGGYNMAAHKWTPVGTMQHRFRGAFIGVSDNETSTTALTDGNYVSIKHLIIDEPNLNDVGMFAFLDSAHVQSIKLEGALVRGSQYVGTLAANTVQSKIINCSVNEDNEGETTSTTILTTRHASGGMVGKADRSTIDKSSTAAKYVGDAVYSGGMVGYATGSKIYNNYMRNLSRMSAVYLGGVAGYADANTTYIPSSKSGDNDGRTYIKNNYVQSIDQGHTQRVGGLVGYAKNTVIENNYVYGDVNGESTEGGIGAVLDDGAAATHNYFESKATNQAVGQFRGNAASSHNESFSGSGNQVTLSQPEYGVDNLTRVLNIWVRNNGDDFRTWRSDLTGTNNGYPIFGSPDMIPVFDSLTLTGCDSVEWNGQVYLFDDEVVFNFVDSLMMVDSTFTLHILVNHASREQVADSVTVGDSYSGYGFNLTATEVEMMANAVNQHGTATIVLMDTLQSATGCDSILTLMLTINRKNAIVQATTQSKIHVYPNPTTSRVTIEATEAMSHVELYDNRGSRLQDYNTHNNKDITIDVSLYPAGAYYLRVHTAGNVTIQKLIKK